MFSHWEDLQKLRRKRDRNFKDQILWWSKFLRILNHDESVELDFAARSFSENNLSAGINKLENVGIDILQI